VGALGYAIGLGIYAVASTRPNVQTEPATEAEALEVVRALGLERDYAFGHGFVSTPHGRMHYVEEGRGRRTVLCLHGNPTWSFLYRKFLRGLALDARVVAPDLIGFGLSEKPSDVGSYTIQGHIDDVEVLVRTLDLRDITLVVQDWGGPIGLGVAARNPERVRSLVIMNTIGFIPEGEGGVPLPLRLLKMPLLGEQLVQGLGLFHRAFVPAGIAREEARDPRVLRAYLDVQGNWDARAGALAFPRLIPSGPDDSAYAVLEETGRYLADYRGPLLLIWGMRDFAFGPQLLEQWRERFPDAQVLELPDAGHFLQEDRPDAIVPAIRSFLSN
jgi:haloalkane dehalogenase